MHLTLIMGMYVYLNYKMSDISLTRIDVIYGCLQNSA